MEGEIDFKAEYKYSIEVNSELDGDIKNITADQITKMVEEQNAINLARAELEEPGKDVRIKENKTENNSNGKLNESDYVYILEPDTVINKVNGHEVKPGNDNGLEDDSDEIEDEASESKLVIDFSRVSNTEENDLDEKTSPDASKDNGEKTSTSVAGACKRKRNMTNVLSSILKNKSLCDEAIENHVANGYMNCDDTDKPRPSKIHVTENHFEKSIFRGMSPIVPQAEPENVLNLSKKNDSGLDLSVGHQSETSPKPLNLVTSTPNNGYQSNGRKNRRKTYVPTKCEKVDANHVDEYVEEYSKDKLNGQTIEIDKDLPMDLTPKTSSQKWSNGPLDLSARNSPVNYAVKKELNSPIDFAVKKERKSPVRDFMSKGKEKNDPMDLSARNSPVMTSTPNNSALSSILNSAPSNKLDTVGMSMLGQASISPMLVPGFNPLMTGANQAQMKSFLELMAKMQSSMPHQNMLQANAQMLQFQALMQNTMLNNSMMSLNKNLFQNGKNAKNDKNGNLVKSESKLEKEGARKKVPEFDMEMWQKHGMLTNGLMGGTNGIYSPTMPFIPANGLLTPKGTPGRRRRTKDPPSAGNTSLPLLDRTSIPKLEDIPLLRTHVDSNNPDVIVDTLKKLFPQQPEHSIKQESSEISTVRFFVKDNEQIQTIVDSLLLVCEIRDEEQELLGGDQGYRNVCRLCNSTFFHMEHLTKHIKKLHVVKRFQCSECDRSFHDAGNYRQHMRVHDENDIPFECPECKRRFRHKCTLKVHLRIHTGEKPFKCEICGATFKISSGLQTHMRKHTGETPYACEYCSMRFKCQSNLKQHLFQHTQARPFTCDICNKSYSRKSIRDAHMLTHSKEFGKFSLSQIPGLSPTADMPLVGSPEMPSLSSPEGPVSPQEPMNLDIPVLSGQSLVAGQ